MVQYRRTSRHCRQEADDRADFSVHHGTIGTTSLGRQLHRGVSPAAGESGADVAAIALAIDEGEADRTVLTSRRRAIVQISHLLGSYCHQRAPLR